MRRGFQTLSAAQSARISSSRRTSWCARPFEPHAQPTRPHARTRTHIPCPPCCSQVTLVLLSDTARNACVPPSPRPALCRRDRRRPCPRRPRRRRPRRRSSLPSLAWHALVLPPPSPHSAAPLRTTAAAALAAATAAALAAAALTAAALAAAALVAAVSVAVTILATVPSPSLAATASCFPSSLAPWLLHAPHECRARLGIEHVRGALPKASQEPGTAPTSHVYPRGCLGRRARHFPFSLFFVPA
jgi:hypothetical protein